MLNTHLVNLLYIHAPPNHAHTHTRTHTHTRGSAVECRVHLIQQTEMHPSLQDTLL